MFKTAWALALALALLSARAHAQGGGAGSQYVEEVRALSRRPEVGPPSTT